MESFQNLLSYKILIYFGIGLLTFIITVIIDITTPKENRRKAIWYLHDSLYTMIALCTCIFGCLAISVSNFIICGVSIITGLLGASIIRRILDKKDKIAESLVDAGTEKIISKINTNDIESDTISNDSQTDTSDI